MTTEHSQQYIRKQLQLAEEALDDARYLVQDNRLKAAADRAYYAMFYAIQGALANAGVKRPKTHGGAISLFGKHYISTGKMDKEFAKDLRDAYNLRQQSDYEVFAVVGEEPVKEMVERARAFIYQVRILLQ